MKKLYLFAVMVITILCSLPINADTPSEGGDDSDENILTKEKGDNGGKRSGDLSYNFITYRYLNSGLQFNIKNGLEGIVMIEGLTSSFQASGEISQDNNYFIYTGDLEGMYCIICTLSDKSVYSGALIIN